MQRVRWLAAVLAMGLAGVVAAQNWPERPVRVVVPWGPVGGTDIVARQLTARLQKVGTDQISAIQPEELARWAGIVSSTGIHGD